MINDDNNNYIVDSNTNIYIEGNLLLIYSSVEMTSSYYKSKFQQLCKSMLVCMTMRWLKFQM